MPVQETTPTPVGSAVTAAFATSLFNEHAAETVSPYPDSRALAGKFGQYLQANLASCVEGTVTADTDGAASGIDVLLPFAPKFVFLQNATSNTMYIKTASMAGLYAMKLTTATPPVFSFANTLVAMGNVAADNDNAFSINAAEITNTHVWNYVAIG